MSERPNILMITCHDLGRFLGCYGHSGVRTPHIDALAAQGIVFEQAYACAPQCSPSRAALFTGRYPHANGVMGLTHANFAWDLHPDERHLGQILKELGYTTSLVGIHHETRPSSPQSVAARCGMDRIRGSGSGEEVTAAALELMREFAGASKPFYLQLGFREPHRMPRGTEEDHVYLGFLGDYMQPDTTRGISELPYLVDDEGSRAEIAEIQGAVHYVDRCVGRIMKALAEWGLEHNTLVVFTTDHGLALPRAKCSLYDPGIETALIMRLPSRGWRGRRKGLVSNVDIVPTLLELLGVPLPESLQGASFLPQLYGERTGEREAVFAEMTYHEYYDPIRCIRTHEHKLIVNFSAAPSFMEPSQSWRPRSRVVVPAQPRASYHPCVELYDLRRDPWERVNIAGSREAEPVRDRLLRSLYRWMVDTRDPLLEGPIASPMHEWALDALQGRAIRGLDAGYNDGL